MTNLDDFIDLNDPEDQTTETGIDPFAIPVHQLEHQTQNDSLQNQQEYQNNQINQNNYMNQSPSINTDTEEQDDHQTYNYNEYLSESTTNTNYERPEYIEVIVTDPETIITESEKFTVYTVKTHSSHHEYHPGNHEVKRRYNQFLSLRHVLKDVRDNSQYAKNWGKIPKLPGDTLQSFLLPNYRFKPEFTQQRAKDLTEYINSILKHPTYLFSQQVIDFLTKPDFEIVKPKTKIVWGNGDESSSDEM